MKNTDCDKLILAVLQEEDYHEAISELNEHGFYMTLIRSSGGFLKKQSIMILIGLNHEDLEEALQFLKKHGERMEMRYQPPVMDGRLLAFSGAPIPMHCGGVVVFVLNVERFERM